jgi:hypothetical protein
MELLTKRYQEKITGSLSCFDRIVVKGTLPTICYAEGMSWYLPKIISKYLTIRNLLSHFGKK